MALWGGRFSQSPADSVFALSRSVQFDWRLAAYDLAASLAHVRALHRGSIIDSATAEALTRALKDLADEISSEEARNADAEQNHGQAIWCNSGDGFQIWAQVSE